METDRELEDFVGWAGEKAFAVDAEAVPGYFGDLHPVRAIVGNARIVGFGESQHHIGAFHRMRLRLFRYLVEEMNFTTFVYETGIVESRLAYDYVLGLHDDLDAACAPIQSGFNAWKGFRDLLRWMRDYNGKAGNDRKLKFYGMDGSQRWFTASTCVEYVCGYLGQVGSEFEGRARNEVLPLAESVHLERIGQTPGDDVAGLARALGDLLCDLETEQIRYIDRSSLGAFAWAHRAAVMACRIGRVASAAHADPERTQHYKWQVRDFSMAREVEWILRQEGPGARLFLGAHNAHLQKVEIAATKTTLGKNLALRFSPDDLVMIAGTNGSSLKPDDPAIPGSFEEGLARTGRPSFLLDLRGAGTGTGAAEWLHRERPCRLNIGYTSASIAEAYDAVYFSSQVDTDVLELQTRFARTWVVLDTARLDAVAGTYDIAGIFGAHVVLEIFRDGDRLLTTGLNSDAELFPMHQTELRPMSESRFAWPDWVFEVTFALDENGIAQGLSLDLPGDSGTFRGTRRG